MIADASGSLAATILAWAGVVFLIIVMVMILAFIFVGIRFLIKLMRQTMKEMDE